MRSGRFNAADLQLYNHLTTMETTITKTTIQEKLQCNCKAENQNVTLWTMKKAAQRVIWKRNDQETGGGRSGDRYLAGKVWTPINTCCGAIRGSWDLPALAGGSQAAERREKSRILRPQCRKERVTERERDQKVSQEQLQGGLRERQATLKGTTLQFLENCTNH